MIGEDERRLAEACRLIEEVNLGGTAIGTRLNAPPRYCELACDYLGELTGIPLVTSPNLIEATQDPGSFVQFSGVLKRIAVKLSKICNDLRLLSSGPRAGLNEINLPPVQAGSSIMPGKVNPVIPEVVNQIAFEVIGNDVTVSFAAEAGQLQLNAFEPIIAHALFESVTHLEMGCRTLAERCVGGITANVDHLRSQVEDSIGLVTALNPIIGYAQATAVAQEAAATGGSVHDIVLCSGLLSKERLDEILSPEALAGVPPQTDPPQSDPDPPHRRSLIPGGCERRRRARRALAEPRQRLRADWRMRLHGGRWRFETWPATEVPCPSRRRGIRPSSCVDSDTVRPFHEDSGRSERTGHRRLTGSSDETDHARAHDRAARRTLGAGRRLGGSQARQARGQGAPGRSSTTKPTFTWNKAARATKYEVRVYNGSAQVLKQAGLGSSRGRAARCCPRTSVSPEGPRQQRPRRRPLEQEPRVHGDDRSGRGRRRCLPGRQSSLHPQAS